MLRTLLKPLLNVKDPVETPTCRCACAFELLESFEDGDAATVAQCVRRHSGVLSGLDIAVMRLAHQLPQGDVPAMAAALRRLGGGGGGGRAGGGVTTLHDLELAPLHDVHESDLC
jgi:hypothetical protein